MLKIIHYVPNLNYTSGIANTIMNYYRNIDRNNVQFYFIYFNKNQKNNFVEEIKKMGGKVDYIVPPTHLIKFRKQMKEYLQNLNNNDSYIFHNHQLAFTILLYPMTKKRNIPFIVHNHMTKYSDKKISSVRNCLLSCPIKYMRNVIIFACSEDAAKLVVKKKRTDYYIMENGIDSDKYVFSNLIRKNVRNDLNIDDEFVIGHIGRFERVKNHDFIFTLYRELYKNNKNSKLLLIGNGSLKDKITDKFKDEEFFNNVIILSERKDIPNLLFAMDCFILPSLFEGLGIVAIEAQATGLPTFISEGVPDDVVIINCKKINSYNVNNWFDCINKIQKTDRIKANIAVKETKYNIKNITKKLEKKYYEIIDEFKEK